MARSNREIFLSSTSEDLQACRAKVREMIVRLRQVTVGMETWGAHPHTPLEACRAQVARSDALIVIVGHRYGCVPGAPDGGDGKTSITWWEARWALDAGKPVYAFLLDETAAWAGKREQDRLAEAKTDKMSVEIGRAVRHLREFRAFLEQKTTRELFTSPDDLGAKVATSLHHWLYKEALATAGPTGPSRAARPPKPMPVSGDVDGATGEPANVRWREQMRLISAQRLVAEPRGVRISVIAGRADTGHPALRDASVRQFEAHSGAEAAGADLGPDDYTTALAALIVGRDNRGGYRGVAPGAELTIHSVLVHGAADEAQLIAAVEAAVLEGSHVVCLSLGSEAPIAAMESVFAKASKLGAVVVCAAGNNGNDHPFFPAAYPGCIAVGAVDGRDRLAPFSNFGKWVSVAAPAHGVVVARTGDRYRTMSGTSFACGAAAGAVALMLSANPKLKPAAVAAILNSTGRPVRLPSEPAQTLPGLTSLDVYDAVSEARTAASARASPKASLRARSP